MKTLRTICQSVLGLCALATLDASPVHAQTAVRIEAGELILPTAVRFEAGTDVLAEGSDSGLAQVMTFLAEKEYITLLRVETNASVLPDRDANLALGTARAKRLAAWFKDRGLSCARLIYVTFGQDKPMVAGQDEQNERVEFRPATLRGRAIGGMPVDGGGLLVQPPCPQ